MTIRPQDFHDVARFLDSGGARPAQEATSRTIIGRAYYAAYLAVRDVLRSQYSDPKFEPSSHEALGQTLSTFNRDTKVKQIGVRLESLRQARVRADYFLGDRITDLVAADHLEDARDLLRELPTVTSFPRVPGRS